MIFLEEVKDEYDLQVIKAHYLT